MLEFAFGFNPIHRNLAILLPITHSGVGKQNMAEIQQTTIVDFSIEFGNRRCPT